MCAIQLYNKIYGQLKSPITQPYYSGSLQQLKAVYIPLAVFNVIHF